MNHYKGRAKTSLVERDFPHHVEMILPEGGFGKRLDAMYEWHRTRGIQAMRGHSRRRERPRLVTWCFADAETATPKPWCKWHSNLFWRRCLSTRN